MTNVKAPQGNRVFYEIEREFSWEGFHNLNVIYALKEIGYSVSEATRLLNCGGIKIWDTKIYGGKIQWYKRGVSRMELVEVGDNLIIGKRILEIKKKPFPTYRKLFYRIRDVWYRAKDIWW